MKQISNTAVCIRPVFELAGNGFRICDCAEIKKSVPANPHSANAVLVAPLGLEFGFFQRGRLFWHYSCIENIFD